MRDKLVDSSFIRVDSPSHSPSDRDSPTLRGRPTLSGVRDSEKMDDIEPCTHLRSGPPAFQQDRRPQEVVRHQVIRKYPPVRLGTISTSLEDVSRRRRDAGSFSAASNFVIDERTHARHIR
jgi:hypothetical protein